MVDYKMLKIIHPALKFKKVSLIEPTNHYYLLIAAEIDKTLTPFFLTSSKKKKILLKQCKQFCLDIEKENDVENATVFKAKLIPPGRGKFLEQRKGKVHIAKFDVTVLIEVKTLTSLEAIKNKRQFKQIEGAIKNASTFVQVITASNVKNISPVNHEKQGVFLFNYFFADNLQQNLAIWEYTAGWFQQETGLDNSTVLLPLSPKQTQYSIINHCRWDKWCNIIPSLIFKKSFHSYVLDNFYANNVAAIPILYKIA